MDYNTISENDSPILPVQSEEVTGASPIGGGSVTYQVDGMTGEQFQTIVGTTEYMNITVGDCMGLYFIGLVAGFTLASLILAVKKGLTSTKEILSKVVD